MKLTSEQSTSIVKYLRGIADIIESAVENGLASDEVTEAVNNAKKADKEAKKDSKKEVKTGSSKSEGQTPDPTATVSNNRKAELEKMAFKDLQTLVKELGEKAVGGKSVLIERILDAEGFNTENDDVAPEETKKPETKATKSKKEVVKEVVKEVEPEEEEEPVDDEDESGEDEEATLYDRIAQETEEYSDEELADILADVGISPKGKRQALLAKIVQAVEDGKIEWSDDDDEDGEEENESVEEKEDTKEADTKEEEATPERAETMDTLEEEIREAYKDKELSDKEIADYLDSYFNEKQKGTKAEKLNMYVEIQRSLVDDDGEVHEFEDPYYVNDEAYCCGHELKEVDGELYCEVCGTSYDNE